MLFIKKYCTIIYIVYLRWFYIRGGGFNIRGGGFYMLCMIKYIQGYYCKPNAIIA
ncbi:hypothetical protein OTSGILL_1388 [Orientia tsutsugamushi str. Gilliam]|uniref:Uncharacterized protein n=1 Tax=Orientia tsutsugamushi str. Gilliam TaxID=1359184 RepID=A0A0F3MAV3_ORITS|nr:hypothetical protein OTSGILL_1388 [Orientia tsutsugamushi str. Gilliam]